MRALFLTVLCATLVSVGAGNAMAAPQPYYNPTNPASPTGYTIGYKLYRTIGCPGKQLLDNPGACANAPVPGLKTAVPAPKQAAPEPAPMPAAPVAAPPMDSDHDGVIDSKDKCPDTPPGVKVDANGCPLDSDHDGVPDYKDKCPHTPMGQLVDANGCAIQHVIILKGVHFDFDSSRLRPESRVILDNAAKVLKINRYPSTEVDGYTDSTGPAAYNLKLSNRRAKAVEDYLIGKGCPVDKLTTRGFGETHPVASNKTRAGRRQNRRVELHVQ